MYSVIRNISLDMEECGQNNLLTGVYSSQAAGGEENTQTGRGWASSHATQTTPGKSRMRSAWFSRVELVYWRCQSWHFTRENRANTHTNLKMSTGTYTHSGNSNTTTPQSQNQLNAFLYSNICLYIPNIDRNISRMWLSHTIIIIITWQHVSAP